MSRAASQRQDTSIISYLNPKSIEAEAFKVFRTNLQFLTIDKTVKSIILTSTAPGEGKSTILANLAVTLGQTEKKVLVIDADLRLPSQHAIFGIDNRLGLSNLLSDGHPFEKYIQDTIADNVALITAGSIPPNPSELIGSEKMSRVISSLAERYDYVLLDCPPTLAVTDAVLLATKADGVILVVDSGKTRMDRAKEAVAQLSQRNIRILGSVLNGVERRRNDRYYYNYGDNK